MTTPFSLCVVAKNQDEVDRWKSIDTNGIATTVINNMGGPGYGVVGLAHLDEHIAAHGEAGVFGLVHGDTHFGPGALRVFFETAAREKACTGIVGTSADLKYVWCRGLRGGQSELNFRHGGEVQIFDGCGIFFPVASGLCFDIERFDSHHCVVEDLSLAARCIGMKLIVPKAEADHLGKVSTKEWIDDWERYASRLRAKYRSLAYIHC